MQNTRLIWAFSAGICALGGVVGACSSSSSSGPGAAANDSGASSGGDSATSSDGGGSSNCVPPGTPNNELGIGGYCETAADCPGQLCSALFGAPPNAWFCTKTCASGQPCGTGESCAKDTRGIACVPNVCIGDAGELYDAGI